MSLARIPLDGLNSDELDRVGQLLGLRKTMRYLADEKERITKAHAARVARLDAESAATEKKLTDLLGGAS
jgi:hypothetical protein